VFDAGDKKVNVVELVASPVLGFDPLDTTAMMVSELQVVLDPLYRVTVYGEVPPDQLTKPVTLIGA